MNFPLFDKALQARVLQTGNGLIVAPTATGKRYIGRRIIAAALEAKEMDIHLYPVLRHVLALSSKPCQSSHSRRCLRLILSLQGQKDAFGMTAR